MLATIFTGFLIVNKRKKLEENQPVEFLPQFLFPKGDTTLLSLPSRSRCPHIYMSIPTGPRMYNHGEDALPQKSTKFLRTHLPCKAKLRSKATVSVVMILNRTDKPGLIQQNNFLDLPHSQRLNKAGPHSVLGGSTDRIFQRTLQVWSPSYINSVIQL